MKRRIVLLIALLVIGTLLAVAIQWPAGSVRLEPDNAGVVAQGQRVYQTNCASCHGDRLQGQVRDWRKRDAEGYLPAPPHDASGHTWHHADKVLFEMTKYGPQAFAGSDYRSRMPAYAGTLTDREIIAVLSFIKAQWPPGIRKRHDLINKQAADR
ncbi:MAG: cytochrome c [Hyphomicrobiaceae bacterium]|nr:cytochrome c [Hyphomicrobiaceae bacterium]